MTSYNFKRKLLILTVTFLLVTQAILGQWTKVGSEPTKYKKAFDSSNQHNGRNPIMLKSIDPDIDGFGALIQNIKPDKYIGKRIRMTGYLKSKDVIAWTGFWFRVDHAGSKQSLSFDNMQDRQIQGTTDWKKYEIVLDVPNEATNIAFGALLTNTGQIWIDDINFEIVDNTVPTTGQREQE